ncbi:hypothetical protein CaCOL14_008102 [Colletotrichum acutatum]
MYGSPLSLIMCALAARLVTSHAVPIDTTINPRSLDEQGREKQPWAAHDVQCHNEADFPGHADINPSMQWEASLSFCASDQGKRIFTTYHDPAENHYPTVFRSRYRWKDNWKINYDFYVQWVAGCRTAFGAQRVDDPLLSKDGKPSCASIMNENFKKCNNGGVGGATQVGCLLYTFNGGKGNNLLTVAELEQRKIYDEKYSITRGPDP